MVGGVADQPENLPGPQLQASEGNVLRQRCDARGLKPPPIEIIARRKVAPAFEPKNWDGWMAGAAIDDREVARLHPQIASAEFCLATYSLIGASWANAR